MRWPWLLALVLLLPGCISLVEDPQPAPSGSPTPGSATPSEDPAPAGPGPTAPATATFVLLDRSFGFNRTQGTGSPYLNLSTHCATVGWTLDPPRVWFNRWQPHEGPSGTGTRGPSPTPDARATSEPPGFQHMGVLVTRIDLDASTNTSFSSFGTAPSSRAFEARGAEVVVPAAFGPTSSVAVLASYDGEVTVDGHALALGTPRTVRVAYEYTNPGGDPPAAYAVEETLTFLLVGEAAYSTVTTGYYCI